MSRKITLLILLGTFLTISTYCSKPYNLVVTNRYVNFHLRIDVESKNGVNDFHMIIGGVDTFDLTLNYFAPVDKYPVDPEPKQEIFFKMPLPAVNSSLMLWEFNPPLTKGSWWNFGLAHMQTGLKITPVIAYWTYHAKKSTPIAILPFPLLVWESSADTVIATVQNSAERNDTIFDIFELYGTKDTRKDIEVKRSYAYTSKGYDMFDLTWDNPDYDSLEWVEVEGDPITVTKDGTAELRFDDFDPKDYSIILVKYTVTRAGEEEPLYYLVDQVEVRKVDRPKEQ
ncbi:hypothetical protein GF359_07140 [candidate division WOR-3 bacterium]|uniref:Uncharacterized protein n=1 Tax=candidate division WOR-3 bacterium TaxID=2052148 RepID=A0A9D5KA56_UNCW3|nr:hypothetical protein [candidate division WOR-3 bacterium]MBD3364974.1 hypothetical protein [candidate division WOR-3 bacterium]